MHGPLEGYRAGPQYLRVPAIALMVVDSVRQGEPSDYLLHAWVVMPNHVHLLITPWVDVPRILRRLKGKTAREANQFLGRTGQAFWQDESYDRLVRSSEEFRRVEQYILENPVRAGLSASRGVISLGRAWQNRAG